MTFGYCNGMSSRQGSCNGWIFAFVQRLSSTAITAEEIVSRWPISAQCSSIEYDEKFTATCVTIIIII